MARRTPEIRDEKLDALLDQADDAFESDEPERALAIADEGLLLAPRSVDVLHYRAAALAALGRIDEAHEAFCAVLKIAPDDLEVLRGAVDLLVVDLGDEKESLEDALDLAKRAIKLARKAHDKQMLAELLLLAGMALDKLGDAKRALEVLGEAASLSPKSCEVALERGIALFQLLRLDDAKKQFEKTLSLDRKEGWANHYLGLVAERKGELDEAKRQFKEARRKLPEELPPPIEVSSEAFDKAVEDALERLPERVRRYLTNVSISVEDLPADEDIAGGEEPLSPEIVGLFVGPALTERTTGDPWSHFPSAILLYQKNLQRTCRSREELIEQIGITLIHEVGHFLGLSEDELYERGLD
jgi:predicted Zn-dependent protease with MMP-like domain/Flp pilus assembly protein TadD